MNKVIVTVIGRQQDQDGEETGIELTSVGRHHARNGTNYITYQESEITGLEGTTTMLKVYQDHVVLVRIGSVAQNQEFWLGKNTYATYATPYGTMNMSVLTRRMNIAFNGASGQIDIEYDLTIDGQWQSVNALSIRIQEEDNHGH